MVSIYIHIPFCKSICTYCDFSKMYYNEDIVNDYLDALESEIKSNYNGEEIYTLYIGGGTPSSLSKKNLEKLFRIVSLFKGYTEFTFECNLEDIKDNLMSYLKNSGVNRISIGIESTHDKYLKYLGRTYKSGDIKPKIEIAKKYFDNISVDLMYAIKGETLNEVREDLDFIKNLGIKHISTYSLIIEEHTVLYNDKTEYINEDLDREMYDLICQELKKFNHYEISNFGISGYESRHNMVYWNNESYYGFGLSASGYINGIRYTNTRNINEYIKGNYILESNKLSKEEIIENEFILGFRKLKGINKKEFNDKYHIDIDSLSIIKKLKDENKLIDSDGYIKIREDLIYVSNSILEEFIGGIYE